jgi:hypothetical protein
VILPAAIAATALALDTPVANSRAAAFYRTCPGQDALKDAMKLSWDEKIDSALDLHKKLRAAWNAPIPQGKSRIMVYWSGGDLETTRTSVIAVRKIDGRWLTTQVGDSVIWLPNAKATPLPLNERDLSADESRRLDQLLDDPCLYAGPTVVGRAAVGAGTSTLEIDTPKHHWRASWYGALTAQEKALVELIDIKD